MKFYVYILRSIEHGRFYYGQTQDLQNRLKQHNNGHSRFTKIFRPWEIYAYKEVETRSEAVRLETKLKNIRHFDKMKDFLIRHEFTIS